MCPHFDPIFQSIPVLSSFHQCALRVLLTVLSFVTDFVGSRFCKRVSVIMSVVTVV